MATTFNDRKIILVTGAGGFLGSHLLRSAPDGIELFGIERRSPCGLDAGRTIVLDIADTAALTGMLDKVHPDIVIHTAALSGEQACRSDVAMARKINVESTAAIGRWTQEHNARMIFTSTDLVFDGRKGQYREDDERHSEMVYGELKIDAEDSLSEMENNLVVRLPLLYGIGLGARKGILWDFMSACSEGRTVDLFTDEFRSPLFVGDAADFIWQLAAQGTTGTLHLAGPERYNRLMIGAAFTAVLNLDGCKVRAVTRADKHMEYRPADTSLDCSLAQEMGFEPLSLDAGLRRIMAGMENGTYPSPG